MPELDLDALTAVAEAATPGEWRHTERGIEAGEYDEVIVPGRVECMAYCYGGTSTLDGDRIDLDGHHIAAFDPPTVLALIAEAREAQRLRREVAALDRVWRENAGDDRDIESRTLRTVSDHLRALVGGGQ